MTAPQMLQTKQVKGDEPILPENELFENEQIDNLFQDDEKENVNMNLQKQQPAAQSKSQK